MVFVLIAFGVFLLVAGITLILNPVIIFTLLRENEDKPGLHVAAVLACLLYTSPSPRDGLLSRMPSSA